MRCSIIKNPPSVNRFAGSRADVVEEQLGGWGLVPITGCPQRAARAAFSDGRAVVPRRRCFGRVPMNRVPTHATRVILNPRWGDSLMPIIGWSPKLLLAFLV